MVDLVAPINKHVKGEMGIWWCRSMHGIFCFAFVVLHAVKKIGSDLLGYIRLAQKEWHAWISTWIEQLVLEFTRFLNVLWYRYKLISSESFIEDLSKAMYRVVLDSSISASTWFGDIISSPSTQGINMIPFFLWEHNPLLILAEVVNLIGCNPVANRRPRVVAFHKRY